MNPPVFGITGWKNSGKTTLAAGLISELTRRGYSVTALKHAHESFDIDQPGRDSFKLRAAGARRVVLSSPKRWAVMQELRDEPEARFEELLAKVGPCDVVVVEGFKNEMFPKLRDKAGWRGIAGAFELENSRRSWPSRPIVPR